jgi:hypothetical protein
MTVIRVSPDNQVRPVQVDISFTVPAGMPRAQVQERGQFEAFEKATPRLKLQGYEFMGSRNVLLFGPMDDTQVEAEGVKSGEMHHDPARREVDAYVLRAWFLRAVETFWSPTGDEAERIRARILRQTVEQFEGAGA